MTFAKWSPKQRMVVLSVLLLIVVGLAAWVVLANRNDTDGSTIDQSLTSAGEQTMQGNYDQALQTLKDAQAQATTTEQKIRILNDLAAAAANANKLDEALAYYNQKHQMDPTSAASDGYLVGELYERQGEITKAIEQYELYLGYITANPPLEDAEARINSLTARIEQLKEVQQ